MSLGWFALLVGTNTAHFYSVLHFYLTLIHEKAWRGNFNRTLLKSSWQKSKNSAMNPIRTGGHGERKPWVGFFVGAVSGRFLGLPGFFFPWVPGLLG
jgi:hypothetical protein